MGVGAGGYPSGAVNEGGPTQEDTMADTSHDPADYQPGGRLDPDEPGIDQREQDRRRADRDRLASEGSSGRD